VTLESKPKDVRLEDWLAERVARLEADAEKQRGEIYKLNRTVEGLQQELRKAANFKHDSLEQRVLGVQFLLGKAAEYAGRELRSRRNGRRG